MTKTGSEPGTIEVLDVVIGDDGSGGSQKSRSAATDWVSEARKHFNMRGRIAVDAGLRLEWPRHEAPSIDWADPDAPDAEPPPWVDVIAPQGDALVRLRLELTRDGPVRRRLEIATLNDDVEVTSGFVRGVGHARVVEEADRALADWAIGRMLGRPWRRDVRRPGRAGRPHLFYARKALRYVRALEAAPASPLKHIIEEERAAGRYATEDQWRAYLKRARDRELLTAAPPGKAGGELTDKARRELRRAGIKES